MPYALNKSRGIVHDELMGTFPSMIAKEIPISAVDRLSHRNGLIIFKRVIPLPKQKEKVDRDKLIVPEGIINDGISNKHKK